MSKHTILYIAIAVVIVIIIIVLITVFVRSRRRELASRHATELRQSARDDALEAQERDAEAARANAAAKQAEVDAERLRREAAERQNDAQAAQSHVDDQVRRADEIDPDVHQRRPRDGDGTAGDDAPGSSRL